MARGHKNKRRGLHPRRELHPGANRTIESLKRLIRAIVRGGPPAFAVFIVDPKDRNELGHYAVARILNLNPEGQAQSLMSAIDLLTDETMADPFLEETHRQERSAK